MDVNEILEEVFTKDIDKIISEQELIGIRLSGGIDSAIMCYLTMKKYPHIKLLPITMYNKLRPAAIKSVGRVLNALKILNPNAKLLDNSETAFFDTFGFVKTKKMIEDFEKYGTKYNPKDVFQRKWFYSLWPKYPNMNMYFSGETLNPPIEEQPKIITGEERKFPKDRNFKREKLYSKTKDKHYGSFKYEFRPFRNKNKKEIAQWVKDLGLFNTLFKVSETCETEVEMYGEYAKPDFFNLTYKDPGVEACMRCWPCREKYWAYGYYDFMKKETDDRYKII